MYQGFTSSFNNNNEDNKSVFGGNKAWRLVPIDLPADMVVHEIKSEEKLIQERRELNTLQSFLTKEYLPETPTEPNDTNNNSPDLIRTKRIPLEDISLNESATSDESSNSFNRYNSMNEQTSLIRQESYQRQPSPVEENFYNPNKSLPQPTSVNETTTSSSSSVTSILSLASLDKAYLKNILDSVSKPTESTKERRTLLPLTLEVKAAAESTAVGAPDSPNGSPTTPRSSEYKRNGASRWSSNTDTDNSNGNTATSTNTWSSNKYNGHQKSYYNKSNNVQRVFFGSKRVHE